MASTQPLVPSIMLLRSLSHAARCRRACIKPTHPNTASRTACAPPQRTLTTTRSRHETPTAPGTQPSERKTPEWKHQRHRDGELIPKPLNRPLGLPHAPQPGQNTGVDTRSSAEKRADFASYDKHLARRQALLTNVFERNYYRDIGNLGKVHKGKSILAPATPFRAALALFFPNLRGLALAGPAGPLRAAETDTTPALRGRVTVLSMVNTEWAGAQTRSFVARAENEALHALVAEYPPARELVQFATVNVEENWLKAWLIRLFWRRVRRDTPRDQWHTYWLNLRGLTDEIRDALGMWNSKVGYVYLLDGSCRIRWAGNGYARDEEKKSLVACVRRLVDEARGVHKVKVSREDAALASELPRAKGQAEAASSA